MPTRAGRPGPCTRTNWKVFAKRGVSFGEHLAKLARNHGMALIISPRAQLLAKPRRGRAGIRAGLSPARSRVGTRGLGPDGGPGAASARVSARSSLALAPFKIISCLQPRPPSTNIHVQQPE